MSNEHVTQLLHKWVDGDEDALEELTPLVYDRLKMLAQRIFHGESAGHTLQPTALLNEAFSMLIGSNVSWKDRNHFFALSARMMRRILVNHARTKQTARRGGGALRITLQDFSDQSASSLELEILSLDIALTGLRNFDTRKAQMLELHYFGGLNYSELSEVLGVAESTVHLDLRTAKAWLNSRLDNG